MKLCIAGTRKYYGPAFYIAARIAINQAVGKFHLDGLELEEIVSGMCPDSPDMIGVDLAKEAGIPVKEFPALWKDLDVPGAVVWTHPDGSQFNRAAGHQRNQQIADYLAQHDSFVVLLWDGKSGGTRDFKKRCEKLKLRVFDFIPEIVTEAKDDATEG